MEESGPPPRRYRSALREEQAERTRALIARAARSGFLDNGWAGTSVRSVAAAAGVSEATVYAVYGTKAGLARSLVDHADSEADVQRLLDEVQRKDGDPPAQLAAHVSFDRRLFERSGDLLRVMTEARRHEPDLAAAYAEGRSRGDRGRRTTFASWPRSAWRPGVGVQHALDAYAVLCSIETYDIATRERGWSPARVERWWRETLVDLLLSRTSPGPR